jgi:hypothetical protein
VRQTDEIYVRLIIIGIGKRAADLVRRGSSGWYW